MPKKTKPPESDDQVDPAEAQRRMDDAVRRMLSTKPETHEEMIDRKHRAGDITPRKVDIERRKKLAPENKTKRK